MMYHLFRSHAREWLAQAHSAVGDVLLCKRLLDAIIERTGVSDWAELWAASEVARVPTVMTFGKWKGTAICDVPSDYKAWLLRQPDVDPYLRVALTK